MVFSFYFLLFHFSNRRNFLNARISIFSFVIKECSKYTCLLKWALFGYNDKRRVYFDFRSMLEARIHEHTLAASAQSMNDAICCMNSVLKQHLFICLVLFIINIVQFVWFWQTIWILVLIYEMKKGQMNGELCWMFYGKNKKSYKEQQQMKHVNIFMVGGCSTGPCIEWAKYFSQNTLCNT